MGADVKGEIIAKFWLHSFQIELTDFFFLLRKFFVDFRKNFIFVEKRAGVDFRQNIRKFF